MKYYLYSIIISFTLIPSFTLASEPHLRASYYSQNVAPQLFFDDKGRPNSGILFDISHAIALQLDMSLEMLPIPRKRIEQALTKNIVDMHCVANPSWYMSQELQWSSVIYQNKDVLINRIGMTQLTDLSNYHQLKIGTTLGFIYPELIHYVDNENIQPITSPTPAGSYKKYREQHVSGFVSASIEASYFFKDAGDSVIVMSKNNIHCVLAPSMKKTSVDRINEAIDYLKSTGQIKAILNKYKYRPTARAPSADGLTE
jgi:polar amino acid transport system substrate-binding protein